MKMFDICNDYFIRTPYMDIKSTLYVFTGFQSNS